MVYQSEFELETEMMEQLKSNGYETVTIRNEQQLLDNFRSILNERHVDKLNGDPLTDKEVQRLLTMINGKGIFETLAFGRFLPKIMLSMSSIFLLINNLVLLQSKKYS